MAIKSLLYSGTLSYGIPAGCALGRREESVTLKKDGRRYRAILRDKIAIEDPYLVLVRAAAFAVQQAEAYAGRVPERSIRDFLIKTSVVI